MIPASSSTIKVTRPLDRMGFWLSAASTTGRDGSPYPMPGAGGGPAPASSRSPTTWKGSRTGVPRRNGCLVRAVMRTDAWPPGGRLTISGLT